MKTSLLLPAAAAFLVASIPLAHAAEGEAKSAAKGDAKPAAAGQPDAKQLAAYRNAAMIIRSFTIALNSENVQQNVKGQLIMCLYENKLADIAAATDQVFKNNPSLKRDNLSDIYRASAAVCGVRFKKAEPAEGAPAPAKPNSDEGR